MKRALLRTLLFTLAALPMVASAADYRNFSVTLYQGTTVAGTATFVANFYPDEFSAPVEEFDVTVDGTRYQVEATALAWYPRIFWSNSELFGFVLSSTSDGAIPCLGFNQEVSGIWRAYTCRVSSGVLYQIDSGSSVVTGSYTVQDGPTTTPATLSGFYPPVDSPAVATNLAKAGQTMPLKFYAETTSGPITDLTTVDLSIISTDCGQLDEGLDPIDSYSNGTSVTLQNLGGGYYQYNWKTIKGDIGCRLVTLALPEAYDAEAIVAAFKFRK